MTIEFGVVIAQQGLSSDEILKVAGEADRVGFDSIWLYDHLFWSKEPLLECWTTLSFLAREVRKVRLGSLVTCHSYRHPSLLAKMTASLDNLSEGRLILGLGAGTSLGFHQREVLSYGFPFPEAAIRVDQLHEYIEIIKQMWSADEASFSGKYYKVDKAICYPKPKQTLGPPIIVAGSSPKFLRLTADLADGYNFWGTQKEFANKIGVLDSFCALTGRDPKSLQKSWHISGVIDKDAEIAKKKLAYHKKRDIIGEPMFGGVPEDWIALFEGYMKVGVTGFQIWFLDQTSLDPLRQFADDVIPRLKELANVYC